MINQVDQWLNEIRVLDGGFGSECQKFTNHEIDSHKAWSCRLLQDDPELVSNVHRSFIRAGCDVISTNTYQASPSSLADALNITEKESTKLMHTAVTIGRKAIQLEAIGSKKKLPILLAGALGPYGACQADGSEYTGSYADKVSFDELYSFHYERAKILIESNVDLLAWETVPLLKEVTVICKVMDQFQSTPCWISIASNDGEKSVAGDPLRSIVEQIKMCNQVFGVGFNCNILHQSIGKALKNLSYINSLEANNKQNKLLLFYANDGQIWVPDEHSSGRKGHYICPESCGPKYWLDNIKPWIRRRGQQTNTLGHDNEASPKAQWVGGCCRVGPELISTLAKWMKPDEYN